MKPTLSIVIPCLNEQQTIASAVEEAKKYADKFFSRSNEIVVADNGSTDNSLEILKSKKFVKIVSVPIRGYGAALHWGITNCSGKFVLFADADLSYPFSNLKHFKSVLEKNPDLVLGSRLKGKIQKGAMPFLNRYVGTPILTWLIKSLYSIPTSDCNSGMRLVKRDFYKRLNMRNSGMEWASELLLKTALHGGQYLEVPILFKKDQRNRPPHLSRWSDGWRHLKAILLLKPVSIIYIMLAFGILSVLSYITNVSFAVTSLFLLSFVVFGFSFLALMYLSFAIEGHHNGISEIINSNKLVSWVIMISISIGATILSLPDARLGTKLILVAVLAVMFMWTFLIETIKTHMINRLPNNV